MERQSTHWADFVKGLSIGVAPAIDSVQKNNISAWLSKAYDAEREWEKQVGFMINMLQRGEIR
jgi:hypothetical protein